MPKEQIEEYKRRIFYEILSWYEDEGDYQPTEKEANQKVTDILNEIISKERYEIIKMIDGIICPVPEIKDGFLIGFEYVKEEIKQALINQTL